MRPAAASIRIVEQAVAAYTEALIEERRVTLPV